MASWLAMQRGCRAPRTEPLSLRVLQVQVLHQDLIWRFVPSTKGLKRDKQGATGSLTHHPLHTASAEPSCTPQRCPPGTTDRVGVHVAERIKVVPWDGHMKTGLPEP